MPERDLNVGPRKILIVDDVRFTRLTLAKIVRNFGEPAVIEAGDGESALALLQQAEGAGTDCIITDLDMPKLDGVGLLQAVREGQAGVPRDTKVVLLTGHSEFDRIGPALHFDVDAFLAKPVSSGAVEACFQRLYAQTTDMPAATAADRLPANGPSSPLNGEQMVPLREIPPDAVLARDLLFGNGRLLLAAGSRLSARTRNSLGELLTMAGLPAEVWIRPAKSAD
jgi:two-component system, chemotaxis family, chemotaxis protein CheY